MAIGIALIGAGIFAQTEHLPAIKACDLLALKAVYSRSQASAEAFAKAAGTPLDVYFGVPAVAGRGLADLLARADVAAVAVAIPIALQPGVVKQVLAAGKHVISEKPVGDTVASARALLAAYAALPTPRPHWAVAENYRYFASLRRAVQEVRGLGGSLVSFSLTSSSLVRPEGRYFQTSWRKVPTHPGGFLLDGGVHHVAALRSLLSATEAGAATTADTPADNTATAATATAATAITQIAAFSSQLEPLLPPVDTLRAIARTRSGISGVITLSFGCEFGPPLEAAVSTTEGRVVWAYNRVTVTRRGADPRHPAVTVIDLTDPAVYPPAEAFGVPAEFAAFARSIAAGAPAVEPQQAPAEALADLQILEAMLVSGAEGGVVKDVLA